MNIFIVNRPEDTFNVIKSVSSAQFSVQIDPFVKWNNLYNQDIFDNSTPQNIIAEFNKCIQKLVQVLSQKELKYQDKYLSRANAKLKNQLLNSNTRTVAQSGKALSRATQALIEDFASFYNPTKDNKKNPGRTWDEKKINDEFILVYMRFVENITRSHYRKYCTDKKEELSSVVLTLLGTEDFRNRILNQKEIKVGEQNPIISYMATLLHLSNSDMFESMDKNNKIKFFKLLRLFFEDKSLHKKIFNKDNIGKDEAIQLYITALSNLAYLITPAENMAKTKDAQIDYKDIQFLLGAAKKFVEDETLRNLIFFPGNLSSAGRNQTMDMFFGLLFHISEHVKYLKNEGVDQLLYVLSTLFGKQFESLFADQDFYTPLLLSCGELSALNNKLNVNQVSRLSNIINQKLFSDEVLKKILPNETLSVDFFRVLIYLFNRWRKLLDSKAIIRAMYDFSNTERIQKMTIKRDDLYSALLILDNAIEEYSCTDDKDIASTFRRIVDTLKNMLNVNFKFKKQIFSTNKIVGKSEDEEKVKYDNELVCLYTEILKNTSQLIDNKNIDIKLRIEFFDLVKNTLLKKVHEDIQAIFFGENESVSKDLICKLIQVFFHLCSQMSLEILTQNKYNKDKVELVQLFLSFIYEEEWRSKIFQPENNGKDGAIDFYFRTLDNIFVSDSKQITMEYTEITLNLIKKLNTKPHNNSFDKDEIFYRKRIVAIEKKLLTIQDKLKSMQPTQKELFKNIKNILKSRKSLPTSKSTNNLLSGMSSSKNSKSKHKPLLLDKSIKMLKSSSSTGNLLVQRKKSSNHKPLLNLNTFKPKTSQINANINPINIKAAFGNNNRQPKLEKAIKQI